MTDLRNNPRLHDLATFAANFSKSDIGELRRRGQMSLNDFQEPTDLAEHAAVYDDAPPNIVRNSSGAPERSSRFPSDDRTELVARPP